MQIRIIRIHKKELYTIGRLYVNDVLFCNTLEDTDRGLKQDMTPEEIAAIKIPKKTAIPYGMYRVRMDIISPKFSLKPEYGFTHGYLPRLMNVPGFDGILIHAGRTADWTDGCLIVGNNTKEGELTKSMEVFTTLYERLMEAEKSNERIFVTIST
jgi:hypothetical protein